MHSASAAAAGEEQKAAAALGLRLSAAAPAATPVWAGIARSVILFRALPAGCWRLHIAPSGKLVNMGLRWADVCALLSPRWSPRRRQTLLADFAALEAAELKRSAGG